jgi:endoglucanase
MMPLRAIVLVGVAGLLVGCGGGDDAGTGAGAGGEGPASGGGAAAGASAGAAGKGGGAAGKGGTAGKSGTSGAGSSGKGGGSGSDGGSGGKGGTGGGSGSGGGGGSSGKGSAGGGSSAKGGTSSGSGGGSGSNAGSGGTVSGNGGSGGPVSGGSGGSSGNGGSSGSGGTAGGGAVGLTVKGNQLLRDGAPFKIHGVNHSGTEYQCVQGGGIFDGPADSSLVTPMKGWNVNAVRLPLNEDCWLAINGVKGAYSGDPYRTAIVDLVALLHQHGMVVILDLHWSAPGTTLAEKQLPMADADHALAFWKSVATTFKNDREVMFDLYNEPFGVSWACWKNGCSANGYQTAGMQALVDAVRSVGAKQPLMLGGLAYANDMTGWVANVVPFVTGELGENDCAPGYIDGYMAWADMHGVGYLGWTWNAWSCGAGPALITAYDGTPTAFGKGFRDHLLTLP